MNVKNLAFMVILVLSAGGPALGQVDSARELGFGEQANSLKDGQSVTTAHQRGAGIPDADRWYLAKSTEGGFSIRFPAPYDDITTVSRGYDGVLFKTHLLTSVASDRTRFTAECVQRADSQVLGGPVSVMEKIKPQLSQFTSTPILSGGTSGYEFEGVTEDGAGMAVETFTAGKQLCQITVLYPENLASKYLDEAHEAFASFKPGA